MSIFRLTRAARLASAPIDAWGRGIVLVVSFGLVAPLSDAIAAGDAILRLPAPARELANSDERFVRFAKSVLAHVEDRLVAQSAPGAAELKTLLGIRVHLALHFADGKLALETAARIRELQTDPGERALAGLITRAIVEARAGRRDVDPAMLGPAVEQALTRMFSEAPRSAVVKVALERSRDRVASLTEASLRSDITGELAAFSAGDPCTLELADRIVRIRHRLTLIAPLREYLVRAHETAMTRYNAGP